jgi:hypothetical protein
MNLVDFDFIKQYDDSIILSIIYESACESELMILAEIIEVYWKSQEEAEND